MSNRNNVLSVVVAVGCLIVGSTAAWSNMESSVAGQVYMTKADFDRAFADAVAMSPRGNMPANREKLRDAGWKRIIVSPLASR
jgi:hypothetical protein